MSPLHQILQRTRRRLILTALLRNAVWSALIFSVIALLLATGRLILHHPPLEPFSLSGCAMGAILLTLILTWHGRPTLQRAAVHLDILGRTRDRFTSGLTLGEQESPTPLQQLALDDCRSFAVTFDPAPLLPVRPPVSAFALAAPLVAGAFLFLQYQASQRIDPATRLAQQELRQKADELEQLHEQIARAAEEDPLLRELADAVEKAMERLQKAAQSKDADARDAMKEMSAIEAMIAAMQKALAAQAEAMNKAAERAEAGDPAGAAAAARAAANAPLSDEERQQLDQALSEARDAGQMDEAARQQALKNLAEQLRRMAQKQSQPRSGGASQRQLQAAMNALQNLKYGQGRSQPRSGSSGNESRQRTMVEAFGPGEEPGREGQSPSDLPGGQPGSERDQGTTESPYGRQARADDPRGEGSHLNSILDEGESLSELVPAAGDTSKSTRRYRELYNAVAADAQNTVDREDIPLASRFFIKRYFENIRPAE